MNETIYIVDDEKRIRDLIRAYLEKEGFIIRDFCSADSALDAFRRTPCDMLVIDIMMPGTNGLDLCRELRKTSNVPIIIVSARDEEIDRIIGLELGSDDYIAKPFSPRELVIRVKNIFRRLSQNNAEIISGVYSYSDIEVDESKHLVTIKGIETDFTAKEYALITLLVKNPGRAYSREQLINSIWGYDYIGDVRPVDDLVKRIRKKLKSAGSAFEVITVWGFGYKSSGGSK